MTAEVERLALLALAGLRVKCAALEARTVRGCPFSRELSAELDVILEHEQTLLDALAELSPRGAAA